MISGKRYFTAFAFTVLLGLPVDMFAEETVKETKAENKDVLVNRRVLILDFLNNNNNADYDYLVNSIPDALLDPLNKTKSFELMDRTIIQNLSSDKKVENRDAYNQNKALETARSQGADILVMGSFAISKEDIISH